MTERRRRRFPLLFLALVAALAATLSGVFPFRQIIAQRRAVELTEEKLEALQVENRLLEEQVTLLGTPEEVERLAREEFGYVRPGETAFVVVSEEGSPPTTVPEPTEAPKREWWDPIWDFLTGTDLDPP